MKLSIKLPGRSSSDGEAPAPTTSRRARLRKLLRQARSVAGYISLFFAAFFLFIWVFLPTEAIAWRISKEAKKRGYIINIQNVTVSPLGKVSLRDVTWIYEPARKGEIPDSLNLERVDVICPAKTLSDGALVYNWTPPPCDGFADPAPEQLRFYSLTEI